MSKKEDTKRPSLVWLLWLLLTGLAACAEFPVEHRTYAEAEHVYETTEDPAEKTAASKSMTYHEGKYHEARRFFEYREACMKSHDHVWFCNGGSEYNERRPPKTVDHWNRVYRADKSTCGCVTRNSF